jgi:putative transposase
MPSRNVVKIDVPESFYHVYARGASKKDIFIEKQDFEYFLSLFKRHLSKEPTVSKVGVPYPHLRAELELVAYCLMKNHFHLYLYQEVEGAMPRLMKSVMTSYSRYFNLKYKQSGSLFESRYKAVRTDTDEYTQHITRYIHLNPKYWKRYPYSSLKYYEGNADAEWINPERIINIFHSRDEYLEFVSDYEEQRDILSRMKYELADL